MTHIVMKSRLVVMNYLEYAVWGAYLTSMGTYLVNVGLASHIGWFYAVQGIVSIFMPALIGIVADRKVPAQVMLGFCHLLAAAFMCMAGSYAERAGDAVEMGPLFSLYAVSVAFYMPTLSLSNSVAYTALTRAGLDTVRDFPPIRVFGTIGFICSMLLVDYLGIQGSHRQFYVSAVIGFVLGGYSMTLPKCPVNHEKK